MNKLKRVWRSFIDLLWSRNVYTTETVTEFPDMLEPKCVYLIGDDSVPWFATLLCPCGCGAFIRLSLLNNDQPRWQAKHHLTGTVTLKPSILRKGGCRSHFFFDVGELFGLQTNQSYVIHHTMSKGI